MGAVNPPPARWHVCPPDPAGQRRLASALGISPLTAQLLINRGLADPAAAAAFLDPGRDRLSAPDDLLEMDRAAARLARAVRDREPVLVYGDYDADGVTATAILVRGLGRCGAQVAFYVPDRRAEGYGLRPDAVAHLAGGGARLLVAVDCGITAPSAAEAARAVGLDLIVLDHHEPSGPLPRALAVVHPRRRRAGLEGAPRTDYCAAGLAYQAWRATSALLGREDPCDDLLSFAAIGTVADAVPLLGDNRVLVALGLRLPARESAPGLGALIEAAALHPPLRVRDLSHALAPRLNAAGRLAHAGAAVRLLTTDDPEEARTIAGDLDRLNQERRALCDQVLAGAVEEVESGRLYEQPAIVLAREGWHPGVVGIVASQLVDRYYRPAVLIALQDGVGRGSARSIPPLHLVETLAEASAHLAAYGGHAMAAGLTIPAEAVDRFRQAFIAAAGARLGAEDLQPVTRVDAEIPLEAITPRLLADLDRLAPFGAGNETPVFVTRGLRAVGTRLVGGGAHLRLLVSDGARTAEAIAFRHGDRAEMLAFTQARLEVAYTIEEDRWRESPAVQMVVADLQTPGLDPSAVTANTGALVRRLFERADDYLDPHRREVEEAPAFHTKVVGVTFEGRQALLPLVRSGEPLRLVRDPRNPRDPHAIQVCLGDGRQLGFLRAGLAARLAPAMDAGARYAAIATALTGGGDRAWGVSIQVHRATAGEDDAPASDRPGGWVPGPGLCDRLVATLGRGRPLSAQQQEVIAALLAGGSAAIRQGPGQGLLVTAVMAAVALTAAGARPVLVVLPRADVADAWHGLAGPWLRATGLRTAAAHGLLAAPGAAEIRAAWDRGELDVLFASALWVQQWQRRAGSVIAVADSLLADEDLALLGDGGCGRVRLVTGPAAREILARAAQAVGADHLAAEAPPRAGLRVMDRRGGGAGEIALVVGRPGQDRTLVLAGDASASVAIARDLRGRHPELADRIAYYHTGLPAALRRALEDLFAAGQLSALVTGAYLAAPALPDGLTRVVAAGLPADPLLAADALGSGAPAGGRCVVELHYDPRALDAVQDALEARYPSREALARCYHELRAYSRGRAWTWDEPAAAPPEIDASPEHLSACLAVLIEAGVVAREDAEGSRARYSLLDPGGRGDLARSLRYREGLRVRAAWAALRAWATGPAAAILADLARP